MNPFYDDPHEIDDFYDGYDSYPQYTKRQEALRTIFFLLAVIAFGLLVVALSMHK